MSKIFNACVMVSFNLYLSCALAQSTTQTVEPPRLVHRFLDSGEVPRTVAPLPVGEIFKGARVNPDGSKTIRAGAQSAGSNEFNRSYCQSMGANNVTNDGIITLGRDAVYGGVCSGAGTVANTPIVQSVPESVNGQTFLPLPTNSGLLNSPFAALQKMPFVISPAKISGFAAPGIQYYVNAATNFYHLPAAKISSATLSIYEVAAPCTISVERVLGPGDAYLSPFLVCIPSKMRSAPAANTGCYGKNSCVEVSGEIRHY